MGAIGFRRLWAVLALMAGALAAPAAQGAPDAASAAAPPQFLLLNSYGPGRPGFDSVVDAFVRRLHAGGLPLENIHVEFLQLNQPNAEMVAPARHAVLLAQYGGQRIDVVVALQQPALNFAVEWPARMSRSSVESEPAGALFRTTPPLTAPWLSP